jgi:molecular chaperone HtpG
MSAAVEQHRFEAEVSQVLRLVINSLYSHPEIFLRELISNASDALDKLRFRALTEPELAGGQPLEIRVRVNEAEKTISIEDFGIGMSHDELKKNLGTVAHSGSRAFLAALEEAKKGDIQLIGQFGVGFYSAYLVADRVEVVSRAAGSSEAWRWSSSGEDAFTLEPAERETHGTELILHVREDKSEYLSSWRIRELIVRYSDYISHPIRLLQERWSKVEGEGKVPEKTWEWEQVNRATALWQRSPAEVKPEEYEDFYHHLTHDFEAPLAHTHFKVEGTQLFNGIVFVPKKPPFDLYALDQRHGMRLYVKRVFIMDDVKELIPSFLRFVRGIVDSDDLPLNVSREILQDSRVVRFIQKQVAKKALDMIATLATDRPDDYTAFWNAYGAVLKEGFHTSPEHKDKLAELARWKTTRSGDGFISLAEYKARMPEGQKAIYYIIAESERAAAKSPHLEALLSRGHEVLLLTDPIDEWAVQGLGEFDELPFVSAMKADLDIAPVKAEGEDELASDDKAKAAALLLRFTEVLRDRVAEVKESSRLTTSAVCLVVPEGGVHAHMERLLKASQPSWSGVGRNHEVNTAHPIIQAIARIAEKNPSHPELESWIEVLYAQAVLTEGSHLDDPIRFVAQVSKLLEGATVHAASALGTTGQTA